jgi:hypothetical protein
VDGPARHVLRSSDVNHRVSYHDVNQHELSVMILLCIILMLNHDPIVILSFVMMSFIIMY